MAHYYDPIEHEDVSNGEGEEDIFPDHGRIICVKELHDHCACLRCKPTEKQYWRVSRCKYGARPWTKQDKPPEGCIWLHYPNDYFCKPYCPDFDPKIKARAFKEVFGFDSDLDAKWDDCFKSIQGLLDEVDETFVCSTVLAEQFANNP